MKTKILALILLCMASLAQAQTSEHFKFKGIEINGDIAEFRSNIQHAGFQTTANENLFKGEFAGESCNLAVYSSPTSSTAYQVIVIYDTDDVNSWTSVKSEYNRLKDLYRSKYGKPSMSTARFISPYYEGDGYELSAMRRGKTSFFCKWKTSNGEIMLAITDNSILISYSDNVNSKLNDEEEKNKSISDI